MTKHHYEKFENANAWRVIDTALTSLVENGDITETTARGYIVGFLCEALSVTGLLNEGEIPPESSSGRHKSL